MWSLLARNMSMVAKTPTARRPATTGADKVGMLGRLEGRRDAMLKAVDGKEEKGKGARKGD